jgi:hypothetical protein
MELYGFGWPGPNPRFGTGVFYILITASSSANFDLKQIACHFLSKYMQSHLMTE